MVCRRRLFYLKDIGLVGLTALLFAVLLLPASAAASLITAHTAKTISRTSVIKIQFGRSMVASEKIGIELDPSPFTFEPRIKGAAKWRDNRTLEFIPNKWLPSGQKYEVRLDLTAIMEKAPEEVFRFTFEVRRQAFAIQLEGLKSAKSGQRNRLSLSGTITTADAADKDDVAEMLKASQQQTFLYPAWEPGQDIRQHRFTIAGIKKLENISTLNLEFDGGPIGAEQKFTSRLEVPAQGPFSVLEARSVHVPERCIELIFSDPLDDQQLLDGLIRFAKPGRFKLRFSKRDNRVRVFVSPGLWGSHRVILDGAIKNIYGDRLGRERSFQLTFKDLKPQVRFVGKRTIIPTTRGLTIPIETANLRAVVATVLYVPNPNIDQFLQVNDLDQDHELNRVGRPVLRRVIPLSFKPEQKNRWVRHGLDLQPLVKRFPNGMFRIELSFFPQHMVARCPNLAGKAAQPVVAKDLPLPEDWDAYLENSAWDSFGGGSQIPWYQMYDHRKDPCHPGYFKYFNDHHIVRGRNVLISDIGLIAKQGQDGTVYVFAVNLKSAKPMFNVKLTLSNYQMQVLAEASTDLNGMAIFKDLPKPFLLSARSGRGDSAQHGYLKMDDGSALAVSHFDTAGRTIRQGLKGFIYGERGVWRPGDPIYLMFILLDEEGRLPADHPVIFELRNPKGKLEDKIVAQKGLNGFYNFSTSTVPDAPTGNWQATVKVGAVQFEKKVKIETIQPNRLKIKLDVGADGAIYSGGRASGRIQGSLSAMWLHGAIAKGLDADIKLTFSPRPTIFKGLESYSFDDLVRSFRSEPKILFEGRLDDKGQTTFNERFDLKGQAPGMLNANFETRVFEPGGAFSIDSFKIPFHPYKRYVGLLTPKGDQARGMLLTDTEHTVQLAMVDDHGRPVERSDVEVVLYKIKWRWWWDKSKESFADFSSGSHYKVIKRGRAAIRDGKGQWRFQINYPHWGRYMIRIADLNGKHMAGKILYIDWPGWAGRGQKQIPGAAAVLSFSGDKPKYNVGEKVVLTIPVSAIGRGLVSIENGTRVLKTDWIEGEGKPVRYTFTATPDMAPNVYAHVTFVQPHLQTANDRPIRMYGITPILVEDPATRLSPIVETPAEFEPETESEIKVREQNGKPMTYTVAVVDEGLLSLTRFKTPNPWNHFYRREALGVKTWDLYDHVAGAYGGILEQLLSIGGGADGEGPGSKKANRFPPMVRFLGPFSLAAQKSATHRLAIPAYVGQVRVMVVAGSGKAFGKTDKSVFVRKPLMLLGTLPRVMSTAENVSLPVSVFALDGRIKTAQVKVQVTGAATLLNGDVKQVVFEGPGDKLAAFRMMAANRPGIAMVEMTAVSGDFRARQKIQIDVRLPTQAVSDVWGTALAPGVTWRKQVDYPGLAGTNQAVLEVSRIPPLNLQKRLSYLIKYPHGCLEQIVSSAFPQLYLDKLVKLTSQQIGQTQTHVSQAIHRLGQFQNPSGGFAYWPGNEDANAWASTYAGHFLLEAQKRGYLVPDRMLDRWQAFQQKRADVWEPAGSRADLIQAYRLFSLALAGRPALGAMNRLREKTGLTVAARWRLAAAYQLAGQAEAARRLVAGAGVRVAPYREMAGTFGSDLRDKAMILEALLIMERHGETFELTKEISDALSSERWLSTQTTAFALMALTRAAVPQSSDQMSYRFDFNGTPQAKVNSYMPLDQHEIPVGQAVKGTIRLTNQGKGTIYARLMVNGLPALGRERAAENGLKLEVYYVNSAGDPIGVDKLAQGSDFFAEIYVTNTSRYRDYRELALSHLVPSGWEIHNARLTGAKTKKQGKFNYQDIRDDRVLTYFDLKRDKTKMFRIGLTAAYKGRFYLPMIQVEAMYDASINARQPGRWIEVVAAED